MKKPMIRSRRLRYGSMTVALTVTLIAALVLLNVIFSMLAGRYGWYADMTGNHLYTVSDEAHEQIKAAIDRAEAAGGNVRAEIVFAEDYNQYEKGEVGHYIRETAKELAETYPDVFSIDWIDCYLDKSLAEDYGMRNAKSIVLRVTRADGSTDSVVFYQQNFFTFEDGNTTTPTGYDGERVFATSFATLLETNRPKVYYTFNHDETLYDYSLFNLLSDAGYAFAELDLYRTPVPEDCDLLITFNPNTDFIIADGVSEKSEITHLEDYLARGGNYMVFMSANTPVLPNFESFLAEWGITVGRGYDAATDKSYNCMIKDPTTALTSDGFTFIADAVATGKGAELTAPLTDREYIPPVVFRDATALLAAEGYAASGEGSYQSGNRTRTDVFVAGSEATAHAAGRQLELSADALPLLTLTEDKTTGASVMVCGSVEFGTEDYLQSAVFGNTDSLLCVLREMGRENVMIGLHYKPFSSSNITSITTRQTTAWTVGLAVPPFVLILGTALIILVRRKYS